MYVTLSLLGFIGGLLSGLLGIGGAIVMIPLLLYIPPLLGYGFLDMKLVSGMVMAQVMFSSVTGCLIHKKNKHFSRELIIYLGVSSLIFSGVGAIISKYLSGVMELSIFALLATFSAITLILPQDKRDSGTSNNENTKIVFNKKLATICSSITGLLVGIVGAGGGFIFIPLMTFILKIPMRIAIGSSLGIVLLSSISGFAGKFFTNQIPLLSSIFLIIGTLPGATIGAMLSHKLSTRFLSSLLASLVIVIAFRTWYQLTDLWVTSLICLFILVLVFLNKLNVGFLRKKTMDLSKVKNRKM